MECKDKYFERIIEKYNRQHVTAFTRKNADKKFLEPFDLELRASPPPAFGNNTDLLKREEEFELFVALHFMKYKLKRSIRSRGARERYFEIYITLRNRAISANWTLVPACISKHTKRFQSDVSFLMGKGSESLISAVDCFDPWRGYKFSTYACNAILKNFLHKPGIKPISTPFDENLSDSLANDQIDNNHELWLERLEKIVQRCVLTQREKEILMCRFGCFGYKTNNNREYLTLKEAASNWNITKERVRQIQMEALCKLREELKIDPILNPLGSKVYYGTFQ